MKLLKPSLHALRFLLILFVCGSVGFFLLGWPSQTKDIQYGVTWSDPYARQLGVNTTQGYFDLLHDLGVRFVRLPAYWTEVEPVRGTYELDRLRSQLDDLASVQGKAVVVVGIRQPRWPECWIPEWVKGLSAEEQERVRLAYVQTVVKTFASHPAVEAWQVENEYTLGMLFGECPMPNQELWKREIALVRSTDTQHPLFTTASGELSFWMDGVFSSFDRVGFSVYRQVIAPTGKRWSYWFIPPWTYARKAILSQGISRMYVSEFQAEPWMQTAISADNLDEQLRAFSPDHLNESIWYSRRMGFSKVYFWGAEWWYWLRTKMNHSEYWELMRTVFRPKT